MLFTSSTFYSPGFKQRSPFRPEIPWVSSSFALLKSRPTICCSRARPKLPFLLLYDTEVQDTKETLLSPKPAAYIGQREIGSEAVAPAYEAGDSDREENPLMRRELIGKHVSVYSPVIGLSI